MASETSVAAALGRCWVNYRQTPDERDATIMMADWLSALRGFDDEAVKAATDVWLMREEWMPTLAGFLTEVEDQARALLRSEVAKHAALPSGPRNDEPMADAHAWAETIRIATGLRYVEPDTRARGADTRGHDHHRGAEHCPVCSAQRRVEARERPFDPPRPQWSTCSECDGSHFVEVDDGRDGLSVRPCSRCNGFAYTLWLGGHYEPNHRCDECAPVGRRRRTEDS